MSVEQVTTLITNVGFPIVCVCAMAWYVYTNNEKQRADIDKLNERHKTEMDNVVQALNNNTIAFTKLNEKLEMILNHKEV